MEKNIELPESPFQDSPDELLLRTAGFLENNTIRLCTLVSRNWRRVFTDRQFWRQKLICDHNVDPKTIDVLRSMSVADTEYRYAKGLSLLEKNRPPLDDNLDSITEIMTVLDPEEGTDPRLTTLCLLDDIKLLKLIPKKDLLFWFGVSCFAGGYHIPKAILDLMPVSLETLGSIIIRSGNLDVVKMVISRQSIESFLSMRLPKVLEFYKTPIDKETVLSGLFWCASQSRSEKMLEFILDDSYLIRQLTATSRENLDRVFFDAIRSGQVSLLKLFIKKSKLSDERINMFLLANYRRTSSRSVNQYIRDRLMRVHGSTAVTDRIDEGLDEGWEDGDLKLLLEPGENDHPQPTNAVLAEAVSLGYGLSAIEFLINRFNLQPTLLTLREAIIKCDHELIRFLLRPHFNLQPTVDTLFGAMSKGRLSIVKLIAENSDLQPTEDIFEDDELTTSVNIINYIKDKYRLIPSPIQMQFNSRLMLCSLFHPRENPVIRPILNIENAQTSVPSCRILLDRISELVTAELVNLEGILIEARNTDPEFFYSYVDYFVETGQEIFGMDLVNIFSFPVIQESTYPHTQYAIAKAALNGEIELSTEVVSSLLIKAIHGFNLLGEEALHALAIEAMTSLTYNSVSMKHT